MYFIYSLVFTLGFLLLLPRFLFDALRHGKYVAGFRERLGGVKALDQNARPVVWLHCVSVGETQAARPLVEGIRRRYPEHQLVVSTVTVTGQELARQVFQSDAARVFYFPFDWRWAARRTLKAIKPSVVVIMETELWPGFLRECKDQSIPVALVNGRLSETSFRRFRLLPRFASQVVNCLSLALMQTESDASRMRGLGLEPNSVFVSGNLKFDAVAINGTDPLTEELRVRFALDDSMPVILAASTHAPEERIIIEAVQRLTRGDAARPPRLIIAPRHPERFGEVSALLKTLDLPAVRRTDSPSAKDRESAVIVLDTIGELRSVFPLAAIVFVGGSIAPTGGHNILEPAATGSCIVTGSHTENFRDIVSCFVDADAIIQLDPMNETESAGVLAAVFQELLDDPQKRKGLGARGRALVELNQGASGRTLDLLAGILTTQHPNDQRRTSTAQGKRST